MRKSRQPLTKEQQQLVVDNLPFAFFWIRRVLPKFPFIKKMLPEEDALASAMYGIVVAAQYFDPSRGKFTSIANKTIKSKMWVDAGRRVNMVPHYMVVRSRDKKHKRIQWPKVSRINFRKSYNNDFNDRSVEHENRMEPCIKDFPVLEFEEEQNKTRNLIERCLKSLERKREFVLRCVFLEDMDNQEIAYLMGMSRERVRQIKESGLIHFKRQWLARGGDDWI